MMQNEYCYLLRSTMHIIHLPDDMLWDLCQRYTPGPGKAIFSIMRNQTPFQAPVTRVIYKSINSPGLHLDGRSIYSEKK